jgi:DNA-binding transcriptional ArsR family regulator
MLNKQYKEFFKTLGNQQRVEIILALLEGPLSVTNVVEKVKGVQSTVSHNLKRLERCSFVEVKINGKQRIYSVNKRTIAPLFRLIEKHADKYCKNLCCT